MISRITFQILICGMSGVCVCVCVFVDNTFLYNFNDAHIVYIWDYD
jgi:hypothetical protein